MDATLEVGVYTYRRPEVRAIQIGTTPESLEAVAEFTRGRVTRGKAGTVRLYFEGGGWCNARPGEWVLRSEDRPWFWTEREWTFETEWEALDG